jgi:hypothetical protein
MRSLALLLLLALLRAAAGDAAVDDPVVQGTLLLLQERLAGPTPTRAKTLIAEVGVTTRQSPAQVRQRLLEALTALSSLSDRDTEAWRAVLEQHETISRRQARRLVREFVATSNDILRSDDDYLLNTSVRWVARSARVPVDETDLFLRQLVAHGIADTTQDWSPEPVGLVVSGWSETYEFKLDPLFLFFDTQLETEARESVRDLQRHIVPRLVRDLAGSEAVRFAFRDRDITALVDPEYAAHVVVQSLRFTGSNADLLPCMDLRLELADKATERIVWQSELSHCTQSHGSATTDRLAPFYDEIARLLSTQLEGYLYTPR